MFRFRRVWLFSPFVVLTLFFAACGWRNAHLSMEYDDVFIAASQYAFSHLPTNKPIYINRSEGAYVSTRFEDFLRKRYSNIRFVSEYQRTKGASFFEVGVVNVSNRFYAKAQILFGVTSKDKNLKQWHDVDFVLTRSPLTPWDNSWHITRINDHK